MSVSRLEPCDSVTLTVVAAGQVVSNRPCCVQALVLSPAAAASTLSLYDPAVSVSESTAPTTTGATLVVTINAVANGASVILPVSGSGINFKNGCVAVVTGSAATGSVHYAKF